MISVHHIPNLDSYLMLGIIWFRYTVYGLHLVNDLEFQLQLHILIVFIATTSVYLLILFSPITLQHNLICLSQLAPLMFSFPFLLLQMIKLADLKKNPRDGPYNEDTLKVKVIAVGPPKEYQKPGPSNMPATTAHMCQISLASGDQWIKATLFDETKLQIIKQDASVVLRQYIKRSGQLVINTTTKLKACPATPVQVQEATRQMAFEAIFPPSTLMTIKDIMESHTMGQLLTIKGVITKVSFACHSMSLFTLHHYQPI